MRHTATHQGVPLVVRGVVISKVMTTSSRSPIQLVLLDQQD